MPLFQNSAEMQRKRNLKALEDKRMAFAARLQELGYHADCSLYTQIGGGFSGVALSGNDILYLTGPAPGADDDFCVLAQPSVQVDLEEVVVQPEGMGGILGFGKRGASGYNIRLTFPDGQTGLMEFVAGQNCFFEQLSGNDPLFSTNRRRGDANFVWEFAPIAKEHVAKSLPRWLKLLREERD